MTRSRCAGFTLAAVLMIAGSGCFPGRKAPAPQQPPPTHAVRDTITDEPMVDPALADAPDDAVGGPVNGGTKRETPSRPRPSTSQRDTAAADVHELPVVERVMTDEERKQTLQRVIADTTAAGAAIRRCTGRTLLPDQESIFDTANSLLAQTTAALKGDELWRAESLARKAKQLASSLSCP